ncbi:MAG: hypothetical protein P4M11_00990 [Candidatus Pacebacteria bacterium]|nr:hypothetical protein [Candidatus Paceibacterota bacterium]
MHKHLGAIEGELELLFDKKGAAKLKKMMSKSKKGMFQMEHEMERLLAKKVKIFANVENRRQDILIAIVRIAMKSLYEGVRRLRISKFGYQQLQVDVNFIETLLREVYGIEDETGYVSAK